MPLLTSSGHVLGAHCLVSDQPRRWSAAEVGELQQMADDVVAGLERRHAGVRGAPVTDASRAAT